MYSGQLNKTLLKSKEGWVEVNRGKKEKPLEELVYRREGEGRKGEKEEGDDVGGGEGRMGGGSVGEVTW